MKHYCKTCGHPITKAAFKMNDKLCNSCLRIATETSNEIRRQAEFSLMACKDCGGNITYRTLCVCDMDPAGGSGLKSHE